MRTELIRRFKTLHTWTGIIAGFALFIAFYAGALSMFKEPINQWASSARAVEWLDAPKRDALFAQVVAKMPAFKSIRVYVRNEPGVPGAVAVVEGRSAATVDVASLNEQGELQLSRQPLTALARWIDIVHRTAGIPGDSEIGTIILGLISALYALAILSGVLILLPTLAQDVLALRLDKNPKRKWLDVHNLFGVASLPFHLIMALSAVVFALHDPIYDLQNASIHRNSPVAEEAFAALKPTPIQGRDIQSPQALIEKVAQIAPQFDIISMDFNAGKPTEQGARPVSVFVRGYTPNAFLRGGTFGVVNLDAATGAVLNDAFLPGVGKKGWSNVVATFFALHFGNFGGGSVQWLYFLLGLMGAAVFYTGNLLWIESRRKPRRPHHPGPVLQTRSARHLGAATVGVCIGSVIGLSATILAAHWITGRTSSPYDWHRAVYYAAFVLAFAYAMWRGAAVAASHLLYAAAALTSAIAIVSGLAMIWPAVSALHATPRSYAVEGVALVAAMGMLWIARASARHALGAPHDSIWAARQDA